MTAPEYGPIAGLLASYRGGACRRYDLGDGELPQDIARRFLWTLNRMLPCGTVVKDGWGADARWTLPTE